MEVTRAERDLLDEAINDAKRFSVDDVYKENLNSVAGKDFRKLKSFKQKWEELPDAIRNDISFIIQSHALTLLTQPREEKGIEFIERLQRKFDLANILDDVQRYARSIRPLRPDPFAEAIALTAIEIWEARGQTFSVGSRETPSEFSRFLAKTLIEFLPAKYELSDRLLTEEFRQLRAVQDAVAVLDRLAKEGRIKKKPRTKGGG